MLIAVLEIQSQPQAPVVPEGRHLQAHKQPLAVHHKYVKPKN